MVVQRGLSPHVGIKSPSSFREGESEPRPSHEGGGEIEDMPPFSVEGEHGPTPVGVFTLNNYGDLYDSHEPLVIFNSVLVLGYHKFRGTDNDPIPESEPQDRGHWNCKCVVIFIVEEGVGISPVVRFIDSREEGVDGGVPLTHNEPRGSSMCPGVTLGVVARQTW